jgi:formate dehydrogenase subunit delta
MDVDKLVRMANQIAANFDYGTNEDLVVAGIADHLTRFWTPSMRAAIIEGHRKQLIDLSPLAARAVERLAEPTTSAA